MNKGELKRTKENELSNWGGDPVLITSLVLQEEELAGALLFRVLDRVVLVDARPEVVRIATEGDAEQFEEAVHAI